MKIIAVVDDRGGLRFNGRRQSRDRVLTEKIREITRGAVLCIAPCSADLFPDAHVCANLPAGAGAQDFCFVEDRPITAYIGGISDVFLFHWNRAYPADVYFDLPMKDFHLVKEEEFAGFSHKKITLEYYTR